jgi:hypothetical protein
MNLKPTELKRQTGRTTRMIEDAMRAVVQGWKDNVRVVIVMFDVNNVSTAQIAMKEYLKGTGMTGVEISHVSQRVMFMHMRHSHMEYVNWKDMSMEGPYKRWPLYVDHDAIHMKVGTKLLEAWLKYDLDEPGSAAYQMLMKNELDSSVADDVAEGVYTSNDLPMAENGEIRAKVHGDRDSY